MDNKLTVVGLSADIENGSQSIMNRIYLLLDLLSGPSPCNSGTAGEPVGGIVASMERTVSNYKAICNSLDHLEDLLGVPRLLPAGKAIMQDQTLNNRTYR